MALDDFEDRFATAVKLALDTSRISGGDELDSSAEAPCPSLDMIASYYEEALSRVFSGVSAPIELVAEDLRAARFALAAVSPSIAG